MQMKFRRAASKYLSYALEREGFKAAFPDKPSEAALLAAKMIRGNGVGPAVFLHGILPRSGTVYVGELLRQHEQISAYPNDIWEFPFLQNSNRVSKIQEEFLWAHEQNFGKFGGDDFSALFGSSLLAYLHTFRLNEKRLLMKVPDVRFLSRFFVTFPYEQLIVLVRDGRDIVHSTLKTWPQIRFWMACVRWRRAAQMVLACDRFFTETGENYWLARFEDAVRKPMQFVRTACEKLDLDPANYPYSAIDQLPVRGSSTLHTSGAVKWEPMMPPPKFSPIGHWKTWSQARKWLFKKLAGQELIQLGYANNNDW